jgi:predicted deacylase
MRSIFRVFPKRREDDLTVELKRLLKSELYHDLDMVKDLSRLEDVCHSSHTAPSSQAL